MTDETYAQRIKDICAAAGLDDLADEMIAGNVAGNTLALAIKTAQASGARNPRTAVRQHPGIAAQLAYTKNQNDGAATAPVTGRGRPEGPTAPTGWEVAAEQVAGEQQAPPEPPQEQPDDGNGDDQPAPAADDGWDRAAQLVAQQMER